MAFDNEEFNKRRQQRMEQRKERMKRKRRLNIILLIVAVCLVLCVSLVMAVKLGWIAPREPQSGDAPQTNVPPAQTGAPQTNPAATDSNGNTVIHFVAGGDVNVTPVTVAAGKGENGLDYTAVFQDVLPIFADADVAAVNLEGILYGDQSNAAPTELIGSLKKLGVDMVQMANSHSISQGIRGLQASLQTLRDQGLEPLGAYPSNEAFKKSGGYVMWDVHGVRVAFVAFTKGMDGMGLPAGSEHCVNLLYKDYNSTYQKVDVDGIREVLKAAEAAKPDITIALVHWGSEYNHQISSTQKKITQIMQEEGVDAIIGTHSHYVQEMEFDPEKGTFVAYSLGDFLGNAEKPGTTYSVILDLEITKDGATGKTKITNYSYVPVFAEKPNEDGTGMRLLRIREAMEGYERNFIRKVPEETYNAMKAALEQIEKSIDPGKK